MSPDPQRWYDILVQRDQELEWLLGLWQEARVGSPKAAVILGEKGLGKTRLALELYRRVAAADGQGYWPDAFSSGDRTLHVNPPLPAKAGYAGEIPWLWWGMRCHVPQGNVTGSGCALGDYRPYLDAHLDAIAARRRLPRVVLDAFLKSAAAAVSVIPGAGIPSAVKDALLAVRTASREWKEAWGAAREVPSAALSRSRQTLRDAVLQAARGFLAPPKGVRGKALPLILLLDDAQWADPVTLDFLEALLLEARQDGWPLLFLATHRETEWNEAFAGEREEKGGLPRVLWSAGFAPAEAARALSPLGAVDAVVQAALPGLSPAEVALVAGRSGGNPLLLHEIIHDLLEQPRLIHAESGALTVAGLRHLETEQFELNQIVRKRLARLPDPVLTALFWSSEQGVRFLGEVSARAAARREGRGVPYVVREREVLAALEVAERPHSIVSLYPASTPARPGEFRQPLYHEAARRLLELNPEEAEEVRQGIRETLSEWFEAGVLDHLGGREIHELLLIAERLFRPSGPRRKHEGHWVRVLWALLSLYRDEWRYLEAEAVAQTLLEAEREGVPLPVGALREVGSFLTSVGQSEEARALLERAVRPADGMPKPGRSTSDVPGTAWLLQALAAVERQAGRWSEARQRLAEAQDLREGELAERGESQAGLSELAAGCLEQGLLELAAGDGITASSYLRKSIRVLDQAEGASGSPVPAFARRDLLRDALTTLGNALVWAGRGAEAAEPMERALALAREAATEDSGAAGRQEELIRALLLAGRVARHAGEERRREMVLAEAVEVAEALVAAHGEAVPALTLLATTFEAEASRRLQAGGGAGAFARRAVEVHRQIRDLHPGQHDPHALLLALLTLAGALASEGPEDREDQAAVHRDILATVVHIGPGDAHPFIAERACASAEALATAAERWPSQAEDSMPAILGALQAVDQVLAGLSLSEVTGETARETWVGFRERLLGALERVQAIRGWLPEVGE